MSPFPRSPRGRLRLRPGLTLLLLLAAAGAWLGAWIERDLLRLFDRGLFEKARTFSALVEWEQGWVEVNVDPAEAPEFRPGPEAQFFQVLDGERVIAGSLEAGGGGLRRPGEGLPEPGYADLALPDGRSWRRLALVFLPQLESDPADVPADPAQGRDADDLHWQGSPRPLTLLLARERGSLDAQLAAARRTLGLALGGAGLLALLFMGWLVRRGLEPLGALARGVRGLDSRSLDRRFGPAERWDTELRPIVAQLDALLERLEGAFAREREFTADAAHELRTPVAELRRLVDVAGRLARSPERLAPLLADLDAVCARMERLIAGLLRLARSDRAGGAPPEALAWPDWLEERLSACDELRGRILERRDGPPLAVQADPAALGAVLGNLLANAGQHGDRGAPVTFGWARAAQGVELRLANGAAGLRPGDLPRLTERFWRADASRSGGERLGLGLAIARALADREGWRLDFELADGRLTAVLGGLPEAEDAMASGAARA